MEYKDIFIYGISFFSLFAQVFLLVSYVGRRGAIQEDEKNETPKMFPTVAIAVPCWNEGETVTATINSLLSLDYPRDKMTIYLIDDGSTDNTWGIIQAYKDTPGFVVRQKENGGKHTVLNYVIENTTADLIGCLDADSYVDQQALKRITAYFEGNPTAMAVVPSLIVYNPKGFVQYAQQVEYYLGIFIKKACGLIDAIHVTPGPFSFYRREVFQKVGGFRPAYNTEDMEIAYRMQTAGMKIMHAHNAYVYTSTPKDIKGLFRQRVRWTNGYIRNTADYRHMLFNWRGGAFSWYTLPSSFFSLLVILALFGNVLYDLVYSLIDHIVRIQATGSIISTSSVHFDPFFISAKSLIFILFITYGILFTLIYLGNKLIQRDFRLSLDILYFFVVYTVVAPFWVLQAMYVAINRSKTKWR